MIVSIFLRGGADTLSLLVPHGDDAYYRARPSLAVPRPGSPDGALDLDGFHGLHPKLAPLHRAWQRGRLAFVQAVGNDDTSGSHFVAQEQVERGEEREKKLSGGWLARYLRGQKSTAPGPLSAIAIAERIPDALRGAPQVAAMRKLDDLRLDPSANQRALATLYEGDPLLAAPAKATFDLLARVDGMRGQKSSAPYPDGSFGCALRDTARLIRARVGLEAACIDLDGWDTHFVQKPLLASVAEKLAQGLAVFDEDLGDARDDVRVVVLTEFGRRTYENGSGGTDHGRGCAMMVLGSGIRGGKVHGRYPGLEEPDVPGPGGLEVTSDYRDVLAEVITSLKRADALPSVFPEHLPKTLGLAA